MMTVSDVVRLLAVMATLSGTLAAVAGSPYASQRGSINVDELSRVVSREEDHVSAVELARWIKGRRNGLRVIDVRTEPEFDAYHLPTAERIPLDSLAAAGLRSTDTIVLYSEGDAHAAQAWVFLRALGLHDVYFLRGGLYEWIQEVMNPTLTIDASRADTLAFQAAAPISRYFGGVPHTGVPAALGDAISLPGFSATPQHARVSRLHRIGAVRRVPDSVASRAVVVVCIRESSFRERTLASQHGRHGIRPRPSALVSRRRSIALHGHLHRERQRRGEVGSRVVSVRLQLGVGTDGRQSQFNKWHS